MVLKDVCHVADIRLNLISTEWLDDEGYSVTFWNGIWKFCKENLIVADARKQSTMYVMHARLNRNEVNVVAGTVGEL